MADAIRWPGDHGPATATPSRHARSLRRTMTIDGHRPDGPHGEVVLNGLARDLCTDALGAASVAATHRLEVRAYFISDQCVHAISAEPSEAALALLVGVGSRSGFRRAVGQALPSSLGDGSLLSLMLDEVPIVTSLSRLALLHSDAIDMTPGSGDPANRRSGKVDICAGWESGSSMSQRIAMGRKPLLPPARRALRLTSPTTPSRGTRWHHDLHAPQRPPAVARRRACAHDPAPLTDRRIGGSSGLTAPVLRIA